MDGPPTFSERLADLASPLFLIYQGVYFFFLTLLTSPLLLPTRGLTAVRFASFAKLWLAYGTLLSQEMAPQLLALLSTVSGTVLDIGPGSGEQLHHFTAANFKKCYGVEPAPELHEGLAKAAVKAGFGVRGSSSGKKGAGEYIVLAAGAEQDQLIPALAKAGVLGSAKASEGIFDEIVCVRALCGVPNQAETVQGLYRLLKPGGRMVVYEHVVNQYNVVAKALQMVYVLLGWSFWLGGCHLNRDTGKVLREAGAWREVSLEVLKGWAAVPYIVGYLVKQ